MKKLIMMTLFSFALAATTTAQMSEATSTGKDFYISQNNGKGRLASKEKPAKDLAAIISFLEAGDRVHIAEGTYISKAGRGTDILEVPVSIIGGYSSDFQTRDPWGKHKTIFSGINDYAKSESSERLAILTNKKFRTWEGTIKIDGIIVDNGARNRYKTDATKLIVRKASGATGDAATPSTAGIKVRVGAMTNVEITNCVVMNCAASQGAMDVQMGRSGKAKIHNNLLVNNTGEGIYCKTLYHSKSDQSEFEVTNNTILFSWKYDPIATYGGSCIMLDASVKVMAKDNVFGFGEMGGVNNVKKCMNLNLTENLFVGNGIFDYREFRSDLPLDELEDYADCLDPNSGGNFSEEIKLDINKDWAAAYFGRTKITREAVDAAVTVANSDANQLRSMFGLNLQGSTVDMDVNVFLHQINLDDVIRLGDSTYEGKGCSNSKMNM